MGLIPHNFVSTKSGLDHFSGSQLGLGGVAVTPFESLVGNAIRWNKPELLDLIQKVLQTYGYPLAQWPDYAKKVGLADKELLKYPRSVFITLIALNDWTAEEWQRAFSAFSMILDSKLISSDEILNACKYAKLKKRIQFVNFLNARKLCY